MTKENYNNIGVEYCTQCMSLLIININKNSDTAVCSNCGSMVIGKTHINVWENLYENIYGEKYLKIKK